MAVTIDDVARAAGVSRATVSRVLNSGPVSRDAEARVQTAIAQLRYSPNSIAVKLRRNEKQIEPPAPLADAPSGASIMEMRAEIARLRASENALKRIIEDFHRNARTILKNGASRAK